MSRNARRWSSAVLSIFFRKGRFIVLQKFIPEGAETSYGEDKSARIMLPEGVFQGEELEKLHEDYDNWKQSVPFTDKNKGQ